MNFLKFFWQKWLSVAQAIGNFQAQVILLGFYLILLAPLALFVRLVIDPLRINLAKLRRQKSNFSGWEHPREDLKQAKKQY